VNNDTTGLNEDPILRFNEIRNSAFLKNPNEYFMSIIRFQLETPDLPMFIPQIKLGQSDPNKTIYTVTLSYPYNGIVYDAQVYVQFVSDNPSQSTPAPPLTTQDMSSRYYYASTYHPFIDQVNVAYVSAFAQLNSAVTGAGGVLPTAHAPFITFDQNTYLFTLVGHQAGYDIRSGDFISIYGNAPFYKLFGAFDRRNFGIGAINGKNFQYIIENKNGVNSETINGIDCFYSTQDYPTTPLWSPVKAVVFQSASLPIMPDLVGTPVVFNSDTALTVGGNNSNISLVMTDFVVNLVKGYEYEPNILYSPSVYRLLDLFGNSPLSQLDVSVYWQNAFGEKIPLRLFSGTSCQIKILFRRKKLGV